MATQRTQASSRRPLPVTRVHFLGPDLHPFPPERLYPFHLRCLPEHQLDLFGQPNSPTAGGANKCGCYVTPTLSLIRETFPC